MTVEARRRAGAVAVVVLAVALDGCAVLAHRPGAAIPTRPAQVILIGNSVTKYTDGIGHPIHGAVINAVNGRTISVPYQADTGLAAVKALRAKGYHGRWIVALGLNDLAFQTHDVQTLIVRIAAVVRAAGGPVEWVIPYVDPTRRADLAVRVPNLIHAAAHVVGPSQLVRWDWIGRPGDTVDGVHLTPFGCAMYAWLLNRAITPSLSTPAPTTTTTRPHA